jgi:protein arginine kinase activator
MRCEHCHEREAIIHLTQIQNAQVTTLHLCEPCAAEKGIETGTPSGKFPLQDFLATLGKGGAEPADAGVDLACAACGATLKDFRQTGRLGCAECYRTFEAPLRDLLRRLHGSAQHVGEGYGPAPAVAAAQPRAGVAAGAGEALAGLRERLRRAVEAEDFELAAELRDRIRGLE